MRTRGAPRWAYLAAAVLAGTWVFGVLRRRLGWWAARLLARWLPDLPAESIDDVTKCALKWANRIPPGWVGPAGPLESVTQALWEKGRYEEAVSYADRALQVRRELGDRRGEVIALAYLGIAHWHAGDLDEALRQFELALPLAQESRDPAAEAGVSWHIGRLHEDRGEPRTALERLERALAIFHDLGDRRRQELAREDICRVGREIDEPLQGRTP